MNRRITRASLVLSASAALCLLLAGVPAFAQADAESTASAKVGKKVKKLSKKVNALQQQVATLEGEQGGPRPPSGPAGGELDGQFPNPGVGTVSGLQLAPSTSPAGGIGFGSDTRLYRSGPNQLETDDGIELKSGGSETRLNPGGVGLLLGDGTESSLGPGGLLLKPALTGSGFVQFGETPSGGIAPANTASLYAEDNGSGLTRLFVLFPGGNKVILATDPM